MPKKEELKINNAVKGTLDSCTGLLLLSSGCFYTSTPNARTNPHNKPFRQVNQQPDHHATDPNSNFKESISK